MLLRNVNILHHGGLATKQLGIVPLYTMAAPGGVSMGGPRDREMSET